MRTDNIFIFSFGSFPAPRQSGQALFAKYSSREHAETALLYTDGTLADQYRRDPTKEGYSGTSGCYVIADCTGPKALGPGNVPCDPEELAGIINRLGLPAFRKISFVACSSAWPQPDEIFFEPSAPDTFAAQFLHHYVSQHPSLPDEIMVAGWEGFVTAYHPQKTPSFLPRDSRFAGAPMDDERVKPLLGKKIIKPTVQGKTSATFYSQHAAQFEGNLPKKVYVWTSTSKVVVPTTLASWTDR